MDSFYLILIAGLAAGVLLLLAKFQPDLAKKYWGYIVGGVAVVSGVVFLIGQKKAPAVPDQEQEKKEQKLHEDLQKVHEEAEVQIKEAAKQQVEIHNEVEEIKNIDDDQERLQRLSDLFNRTRRR